MKFLAVLLLLVAQSASAQWLFPQTQVMRVEVAKPKDVPTLYGEVDQASAAAVIEAIQLANKGDTNKPILFFLQSNGGSVSAGDAIISAMRVSRRPVMTVAVGPCISMCVMVYQHGAKRLIFPNAILMIHNAHMGVSGDLPQIANELTLVLKLWAQSEVFTAKRAEIPLEVFRMHEALQWWLTADEAVQAHLADAVVNMPDYPVPHE
jgi:ATP-dependent Clp protease protease subunit